MPELEDHHNNARSSSRHYFLGLYVRPSKKYASVDSRFGLLTRPSIQTEFGASKDDLGGARIDRPFLCCGTIAVIAV